MRCGPRPRPANPCARVTTRWCASIRDRKGPANCRSAGPAVTRRCRSISGGRGPAVLAVGGELKNTFCLTDGSRAYLSGHIGDMATWETLRAFERAVDQLSEIRGKPARLAADLHPGYHTRGWAERQVGDRPLDLVQHHHAHVVSLLAEHGRIGEPDHRSLLRRHRLRLRPNHLGRRDSRARHRQPPIRSRSATCCRCRCRAVMPRCATRGGWRCPSCGWPASTGPRTWRRSPPQPRTNCGSSVRNWTPGRAACRVRAWAGCSTPSPPCSGCGTGSTTKARPPSNSRRSRSRPVRRPGRRCRWRCVPTG